MNENFRAKAALLLNEVEMLRQHRDEPILVAIDGRSGVGKSTFATEIGAQLDCTLVVGDDFFAGGTEVSYGLSPKELAGICIDRKRLREVLKELKSGCDASYVAFDWSAFDGRLAEVETVLRAKSLLILEGAYSYHSDLRDLVDLAVLVEVPSEIRTKRLLAREGQLSEWELQWHQAEDWYFSEVSPSSIFHHRIMNV